MVDQVIGDAAQPCTPDPAPAVRRHDDQVDADLTRVLGECGTHGTLQRDRGREADSAFAQAGLDATQVCPLGLPGRQLDRREHPGRARVERGGWNLVHERQTELTVALLRDLDGQGKRLFGQR